jgi:hypothetical protein
MRVGIVGTLTGNLMPVIHAVRQVTAQDVSSLGNALGRVVRTRRGGEQQRGRVGKYAVVMDRDTVLQAAHTKCQKM